MSSIKNNFSESDIYCVSHTNFNPTAAASTVLTVFDVDVAVTSPGTVSNVSIDWGDGSAAENMTLDSGSTYTASHTYAAAGTYVVKVTTTVTGQAETQTDYVRVVVS